MTIVAVSGGFDPVHIGHILHFKEAKSLGDHMLVILHSDQWLINKKGFVFMPYEERKAILESIRYVDEVVPAVDDDPSVYKSLEYYKPDVFAKGGDRTEGNLPKCELDICRKHNIKIVYGVGGKKIQSSSELVRNLRRERNV
jgi:D-beta-D-heptose 7-phosphate kinase/D-beta-D-heptose 1-phosphate adenosyltransferase